MSTTPNVQYAYANGSANTIRSTSLTYPNSRVLNANYGTSGDIDDSASPVASLIDNDGTTHLADYSYLGAAGIVIDDYTQPQIRYTLVSVTGSVDPVTGDIYTGLDLFSRVKDLRWYNYGTSTDAVRIQHGYDRASNRLWRQDPVATANGAAFDELYAYDGLYRLKSMQRGTLNGSQTAIVGGTATFGQCWTLDATGNWKGFREDDTGSGTWDLVQSRTANTVNEITNITNSVGSAWANPAYDPNGNMTSLPKPAAPASTLTGTFDAWNRLVKLVDATSSDTVQKNAYDALRRRTIKQAYTSGTLSETRHLYYSSAWQVLEERVGTSTNAERQFVWGLRYIDDLVLRDRDTTGGGTLNERLYALQDPNWNVVGIADTTGVVQERYSYSGYGMPTFLSSAFVEQSRTLLDWETLFAGYRFDGGTGLYQIRHRPYHPVLGNWCAQDPLGFIGGDVNLYRYVKNAPTISIDPSGLEIADCCKKGASKDKCVYIFTWEPRGQFNMRFGHSGVSLSASDDPVYGFHGKGIRIDLRKGYKAGIKERTIIGEMADEKIKSVYRCCCLTDNEYKKYQNEITALEKKARTEDKTDLHGREYSVIDSRGAAGKAMTEQSYPVCSGTAAYEARLGCANIGPDKGNDPLILEQALAANKYYEKVDSSYIPKPAAPAATTK